MSIIDQIKEKAKQLGKTIVLPESDDERVIRAAELIKKEGISNVILVGEEVRLREDAKKYGFEGKEFVSIVVKGEKPGILENVYVRISDKFSYEVHLDTDDANAFLIKNGDEAELIVK